MTQVAVITSKSESLALMVNRRSLILQVQDVLDNLNEVDLAIAQSGTKETIKSYITRDEQGFIEEFSKACQIIARDCGIKSWNSSSMKHDSIRAYGLVKRFYSDFTLSEFKLSFELTLVGKLDEYLPKGKDGYADKHHYQAFSLDFISKILNAMRKKKNATWSKAHALNPAPEKIITQADKTQFREGFINQICQQFELLRDKNSFSFLSPSLVVKELEKCGLVKEIPKPDEENVSRAKHEIALMTFLDMSVRRQILNNPDDPRLLVGINNDVCTQLIRKVFKDLIDQGKHIREFLQTNYQREPVEVDKSGD